MIRRIGFIALCCLEISSIVLRFGFVSLYDNYKLYNYAYVALYALLTVEPCSPEESFLMASFAGLARRSKL